ncbi:MAG: deoxyhypusine synthase [Acidobacteriota bacterium]
MTDASHPALSGPPIAPDGLTAETSVAELIDRTFLAYNAGKLQRACRLFAEKILEPDVTIGMSLSGALTPAGLGRSCLVPLIEAGFVDWIISTGANLYHDCHHALRFQLHRGSENMDDARLREEGVIRIYDILLPYDALLQTDAFIREVSKGARFQRSMSTAEYHFLLGEYVAEREQKLGTVRSSVLAAAHRLAVPIFVSSPGDSSIGMNLSALSLTGNGLAIDVHADVHQSAAIVWDAKATKGKSAAVIWGGGSPKNFLLQTEPQIQEVLGLAEKGHDYFVQFTDARPDTGGLSGATPSEAVSWGKIDPKQLPDTVVVYGDSSISMPLFTAYALARRPPRKPRHLMKRLIGIGERLADAYRGSQPGC